VAADRLRTAAGSASGGVAGAADREHSQVVAGSYERGQVTAGERQDGQVTARHTGRGQVTAVVCAAFDEVTDEEILAVRELVRAAGVPLPLRPPHRPHLTLAAARTARERLGDVVTVAESVASRHCAVPIVLDQVGRFGRAGALWLGPTASPALIALQRDAEESLRAAGWAPAFGHRSDPDQWVPHCTLATRLAKPQLRAIQATLREEYRTIDGSISALAVILVGGRGDVSLAALGDRQLSAPWSAADTP
jgi:2'-5' RNA ligase